MTVLVDTPVWSEFFRRAAPKLHVHRRLRALVDAGEAAIIGPVRQELLSGIKDVRQFEAMRSAMRGFSNEPILAADYETAAMMFNQCRSNGIQGSNTDFLICAISTRMGAPVFTLNQDFQLFSQLLPIQLY